MNSKTTCQTILLSDTPEKRDLFNGAHEKLADGILSLIETEKGGKTIGLEGEWGSGKSTVINLLRMNLLKNKNNAVIIFDAWAHQGDPLRRSFLETIVKHLISEEWVNQENWENELDTLSKKKQITTTKNSPKLTIFGILITISFLLIVPIGIALLNAAISAPGYISFSGGIFTISLLSAAIICTISPLIIYLLGVVGAILCGTMKYFPKIGKRIKCDFTFSGAILAQNYETEVISSTYLAPEPTSIEFEEKFELLIKEALSMDSKKLVLVLDNLDRIDSGNALSILTTLQTFLQYDGRERNEYNGLWVVLPYDLHGLAKIWNPNSETKDASSIDELTFSMLSKRFQVRFSVPPLLLSDWRDYVINQLKIAFPSHTTQEDLKDFEATYLIYRDIINFTKKPIPSPRDIKLFINQIGSIHRQWGDEFPISHMAYYVLSIRNNENFQEGLRNKSLLLFPQFIHNEHILENLAAMYFNVKKDLAFQFLLQAPIETALGEKDYEAIAKFEELHGKGFWATLENMNFDHYQDRGVANAGITLEQSKVFSKDGYTGQKEQTLKSISNGIQKIDNLTLFDKDIALGFISIAKLVNQPEIITKVMGFLNSTHKSQSLDSITTWTQGVTTVFENSWVIEKDIKLPEKILIPGDAEMFLSACLSLYDTQNNPELWKKFTTSLKPADIVQLFSTKINEVMTNNHKKCLAVAIEILDEAKWNTIGEVVFNKLNSFANYENEEIEALLRSIYLLRTKNLLPSEKLDELRVGGQLYHYLFIAQAKTLVNIDLVALLAFAILSGSQKIAEPPANGNSVQGYSYLTNDLFQKPTSEFSSSLYKTISKDHRLTFLYNLPIKAKTLKSNLTDLVVENDLEILSPEALLVNWSKFENFYSEKLEALLSKINTEQKMTKYIIETEFKLENIKLYSILVQGENFKEDKLFSNWLKTNLQNLDKESWGNGLQTESELISLVISFIKKAENEKLDLGIPYHDALLDHASKFIKGEAKVTNLGESWKIIPSALTEDIRVAFRLRLIELTKDAKGEINDKFFVYYSEEISHRESLQNDDEVVLKLFSPLVSNKNPAGLKWLAEFLDKNPTFLNDYKVEFAVGEFKERVSATLKEEGLPEEVRTTLSKIQSYFKQSSDTSTKEG